MSVQHIHDTGLNVLCTSSKQQPHEKEFNYCDLKIRKLRHTKIKTLDQIHNNLKIVNLEIIILSEVCKKDK